MGARRSKSSKVAVDWRSEHKHLFDGIGLVWPPLRDEMTTVVMDGGLLPREVEAAWLLHNMFWPMAEGIKVEYLDINATASRILVPFLDSDGRPKAGKTPWRREPPTLTGSMRLILRYIGPGDRVRIRAADAFEEMRLIGWQDSYSNVSEMPPASHITAEKLELYSNLAGIGSAQV